MADIVSRLQRVIEEFMGNEALLEMLETEAATEMLNWGTRMAATLVQRTRELEDDSAELALLPRLKAIRQTMRSVGNWASGKYVEPDDRVRLREKLLENFKVVFGENARLPTSDKMDEMLNQVDDRGLTPHQLILKLRELLETSIGGGNHAEENQT